MVVVLDYNAHTGMHATGSLSSCIMKIINVSLRMADSRNILIGCSFTLRCHSVFRVLFYGPGRCRLHEHYAQRHKSKQLLIFYDRTLIGLDLGPRPRYV